VLTLYYRTRCPYSFRVQLVLAEKHLPFSRRIVGRDEGPPDGDELFGGGIPALGDGSFTVSHSMIIAEYVEDAFPKPGLRPPDARGRALLRAAMQRIDAELTRPLQRAAPTGGDIGLLERFRQVAGDWDRRLGDNGVLFGMEFSLADAWLFAALEKAGSLGLEAPAGLKKLGAWVGRMRERESLRSERLSTDG
jgi:glutathione S-transferase